MKYRSRKRARDYLLEQGVPIGSNALAKLAARGGGPRFRYWGRDAVYTEDDLDDWVQQKLSPPVQARLAARRKGRQRGRAPIDAPPAPTRRARPYKPRRKKPIPTELADLSA